MTVIWNGCVRRNNTFGSNTGMVANLDWPKDHGAIVYAEPSQGGKVDRRAMANIDEVILRKIAFQANSHTATNLGSKQSIVCVHEPIVRAPDTTQEELAANVNDPPAKRQKEFSNCERFERSDHSIQRSSCIDLPAKIVA
jgi:hypothetical protein